MFENKHYSQDFQNLQFDWLRSHRTDNVDKIWMDRLTNSQIGMNWKMDLPSLRGASPEVLISFKTTLRN